MKKTVIMLSILAGSAAGICFAGNNETGNPPNPPVAGQGGPNTQAGANTMDNSDRSTNSWSTNSTNSSNNY
jgi:hypothetical protein